MNHTDPKLAFVVDFDGTIVTKDLSTEMARAFVEETWRKVDQAYRSGAITIRGWLTEVAARLPVDHDALLRFAMNAYELRPGFLEFLSWAAAGGVPVVVASDGLGFYVRPILSAVGAGHLTVYCNGLLRDRVQIGHPHSTCTVCGTCKADVVIRLQAEGRRTIFVGDGPNDIFGASQADAVFARDLLAARCQSLRIPYIAWHTFVDILESTREGLAYRRGPWNACPSRPQKIPHSKAGDSLRSMNARKESCMT